MLSLNDWLAIIYNNCYAAHNKNVFLCAQFVDKL